MKIHFIGIGGIGVSALAKYYLNKGDEVSGSDMEKNSLIEDLEKLGAVFRGSHSEDNIDESIDLVIHSPAVKEDNEELIKARELGVKTLSYPEALGELSKEFFTIAITGTHGKSTTTAMMALVLIEAGMDPTVIVGTKLKEFGDSNCRIGNSEYLVIEACEHEDSFLNYHPQIGVILNMEADHLDYYGNIENIKKSFNQFAKQSETIVYNKDKLDYEGYGFSSQQEEFDKLKEVLKVPGEHNIMNALAVLTVARILKIEDGVVFSALSKFTGTWRRFDVDDKSFPYTVINDYAHHPTEIMATLKSVREKFTEQRIVCVFQPHQYSRTYCLFNDFVRAFNESLSNNWINDLIIYPIYTVKGRESKEIMEQVSSEKLCKEIKNCIYLDSFEKIKGWINGNIKEKDVLIIMGAGDIYNLYKYLLETKKDDNME